MPGCEMGVHYSGRHMDVHYPNRLGRLPRAVGVRRVAPLFESRVALQAVAGTRAPDIGRGGLEAPAPATRSV